MGVARELRDGGTLGREGAAWRREGGSGSTMERERERSLGRDGSLGRHCDLRGAELVQVAERQLSQIQHVHGYVTHTHITPAQVTSSGFSPCASPSVGIQTQTCDVHIFTDNCQSVPTAASLLLRKHAHTFGSGRSRCVRSIFAACPSVRVEINSADKCRTSGARCSFLLPCFETFSWILF